MQRGQRGDVRADVHGDVLQRLRDRAAVDVRQRVFRDPEHQDVPRPEREDVGGRAARGGDGGERAGGGGGWRSVCVVSGDGPACVLRRAPIVANRVLFVLPNATDYTYGEVAGGHRSFWDSLCDGEKPGGCGSCRVSINMFHLVHRQARTILSDAREGREWADFEREMCRTDDVSHRR